MVNEKMATTAVIISKDVKLKNILTDRDLSENDQLIISCENDISSLSSSTYDAYIYDVDLSIEKVPATLATIFKLRRDVGENIFILTGKKSDLDIVLNNNSVAKTISRTLSKPFSYMQLLLAIKSCAKEAQITSYKSAPKPTSNNKRVVVLSLITAFLFISVFSWFNFQESTPKTIPSHNNLIIESPITKPDENQNIVSSTERVDQLNRLALTALRESRLTEPINNNAIHYLNLIKEIDPYNADANQTHSQLFDLLEASYQQISSNGNNVQTKAIIDSILKLEPYNHIYGIRLIELNNEADNSSLHEESTSLQLKDTQQERYKEPLNTGLPKTIEVTKNEPLLPEIKNENDVSYASINKSNVDLQQTALVKSTEIVKPAEIVKRSEPKYPKPARDLNREGWVELEYQVNELGRAIHIKVVDGENIKVFKNAAIKAIEKWEFSPSVNVADNSPVLSSPMKSKFNFELTF